MFKKIVLVCIFLAKVQSFACHGGEVAAGEQPHPGDVTSPVCSVLNPNICTSIWFQSFVSTKAPAQFILKINGANVTLNQIKIDLWMEMSPGHGHGSAPLTYTEIMPNTFQVTNAYFVMTGNWKIRLHLTDGVKTETLEVPIYVAE